MEVIKGAAIVVAILLAVGLAVGCCLLAVVEAAAVFAVMQIVALCALVFYAFLAVLALVWIAQNSDRGVFLRRRPPWRTTPFSAPCSSIFTASC